MKNIFVVFIFLSSSLFSQNADIKLLKSINLNRNPGNDNTFIFLSNTVGPAGILVPAGIIGAGYITHDSIIKNKGLVVGASLAVTLGLTAALKYGISRSRPYVTYPELDNVVNEGTPSFPSGHTSMSFSTATSLSIAFPKWYVIAPSYLWAGTVSYSRMHLGVHYPTDVLAGAITGAGTAYLCHKANQWLYKQHRKK
ncbi:MAG: phosphatase PAP2 family protein [Bacteroidia bacterium]|jgi:membrane-associated phospholipid phosphatase